MSNLAIWLNDFSELSAKICLDLEKNKAYSNKTMSELQEESLGLINQTTLSKTIANGYTIVYFLDKVQRELNANKK